MHASISSSTTYSGRASESLLRVRGPGFWGGGREKVEPGPPVRQGLVLLRSSPVRLSLSRSLLPLLRSLSPTANTSTACLITTTPTTTTLDTVHIPPTTTHMHAGARTMLPSDRE